METAICYTVGSHVENGRENGNYSVLRSTGTYSLLGFLQCCVKKSRLNNELGISSGGRPAARSSKNNKHASCEGDEFKKRNNQKSST